VGYIPAHNYRYEKNSHADEERLIMERNIDYRQNDIIFEIVVWLFVIAVVLFDIKVTFF